MEQLVTRRGGSYKAIVEIRTRWGLEHTTAQLPPASEDILLPASMGEPDGSEDQRESWLEAHQRWTEDLHYVLLHSVPEKYVNSKFTLYPAGPRDPERWLPWYRFAAACVLFDPPRTEDLPTFAEYGGLPLLPGGNAKEEPVLGVLDSRDQRIEQIGLKLEMAEKEAAFRLMWEHHEEFAEFDFDDAWREVYQRYGVELWKKRVQTREEYNHEIENHISVYYVEVDDAPVNELRERIAAVAARKREARPSVGRDRRNRLWAITCAILKDERGWTQKEIAELRGLRDETQVSKWVKDGRDLLR